MSAWYPARAKRRECHTLLKKFSEEVTLEQLLSNETYARQQVEERGEDTVEEGKICSETQRNKSFNSKEKSTSFIPRASKWVE